MKKLLLALVLSCSVVILCNGQSMRNLTDVRPIAPKGYILFTEDGAKAALKAKAELEIATKQLALLGASLAEYEKIAKAEAAIAKQQELIIKKQKRFIFWTNVKMYSGWAVAVGILIAKT